MRQFIYLTTLSIFGLTACTSEYKKAERGLEYKIIGNGRGNKVAYGNFLQMHTKQIYQGSNMDTVLVDSRDIMPEIERYDSLSYPRDLFKIFGQVRKADSLVLRLSADSIFGSNMQPPPSFVKKGGYMYTSIKVINIFDSKAQADSAYAAEMKIAEPKIFKRQVQEVEKTLLLNKRQLEVDDKIISDYLAKNNIIASKSKWGTYVVINKEGVGDKIDNKSVVTINYSGRTLDSGRTFDSNIDPKFNHIGPLQVRTSTLGGMMLGWSDGLGQLRKGTKATFYIPSTLAYGTVGDLKKKIKPNANLVFDIEIVDVINEDSFDAQPKSIQKKL